MKVEAKAILRWALGTLGVAVLAACGGSGDGSPDAGGDAADVESACRAICGSKDACGLKVLSVCSAAEPDPNDPESVSAAGCVSGSDLELCAAACVEDFRTSTQSADCVQARVATLACHFRTCDAVLAALTEAGACPAERAAEDAACGNANDRRPVPCEGVGADDIASQGPEGCYQQTSGPYIAIDYQARYFDQLVVAGMCPSPDSSDAGRHDVSLQLLSYTRDGTVSLQPGDRISDGGVLRPVSEVLRAVDFVFSLSSDCDASIDGASFQSCVEPADRPGDQQGVSLLAQDLRYAVPGGPSRAADDRLVVLLMDNSGSLKGQPDPLLPPDPSKASDPRDERITFMKNLVRLPYIDPNTYFSLVWFDSRQPNIRPDFATPTRQRDMLVCLAGGSAAACQADPAMDGLTKLERGETGGTPLADALDQTYNIVIDADATRDLNPVVILFTDGVEAGDSSGSGKSLADVTAKYAEHSQGGEKTPVPVIVLHLQPTVASGFQRGRDAGLQALACATGGEYIFLERAEEFTLSDTLEALVANRITGAWKLGVVSAETAGLEAGPYLMSTDLQLTLAGKMVTTQLKRAADLATDDTRLFFVR